MFRGNCLPDSVMAYLKIKAAGSFKKIVPPYLPNYMASYARNQ
jgi:hypothetical protein